MGVLNKLYDVHKKKNEFHLNEIYNPTHDKSPGFFQPYKNFKDVGNALEAVVLKPRVNGVLLMDNHFKENEPRMDTIARGIYLFASCLLDPVFEIIKVVTRLLSSLISVLASLLTCNPMNPGSNHSDDEEMIARVF